MTHPSDTAAASLPSAFSLDVPAACRRIRERNPILRAYVTTRLEAALEEDEALSRQPARSPLHGIPYGLKDEWDTAGIRTTAGSHRHRDRVPATSSPVHEVFRSAGAVLVGKTNLSDMGLAPEASSYVAGAARNPFDATRTAGGSSGGAAAAVADGMQAFDWGTDIGGSIRLPAAFCGILGLRLSSQTWPIESLFPMPPPGLAWMCGQGPMTRTIAQMREVVRAAAPRLKTGTSSPMGPIRGLLVHAPDRPGEWPGFTDEVVPALRAAFHGELEVEVDRTLPQTTRARDVYSAVWASHFEEILACDPTITLRKGLGAVLSSVLLRGALGDRRFHPVTAELLLLIALGRYTVFRNPARALAAATAVREEMASRWEKGYLIVAPVSVYSPPRVGRSNWNPHIISNTVAGNLADATGLSIPSGRFPTGLPRAIQLQGPPGSEMRLIDLAERILADVPASAGAGRGRHGR